MHAHTCTQTFLEIKCFDNLVKSHLVDLRSFLFKSFRKNLSNHDMDLITLFKEKDKIDNKIKSFTPPFREISYHASKSNIYGLRSFLNPLYKLFLRLILQPQVQKTVTNNINQGTPICTLFHNEVSYRALKTILE